MNPLTLSMCFQKIFFKKEVIRVHSLPCVFIYINKILTPVTILIRCVAVNAICKIYWPIEAKKILDDILLFKYYTRLI